MSDDTPTQRFDQPPTAPLPNGSDPEQRKSRALLITLIVVGAVLLAAIIVILVLLLGRGQSTGNPTSSPTPTVTTPSPTPTHSATPTPTPTQTVAPPSTAPTVASFTINNTTVTCDANSGVQDPQLTFSWTSTNASEAFFGVDTTDAQANPYYSNLPPNGNTTNFPGGSATFAYSCKAPSHVYTITVVGNGQKASKSITVKNNGSQG